MNIHPIKNIPNLPENPWLTRGTAHILKANKPVQPVPKEPLQLSSTQNQQFKEYSVLSQDFVSKTSIEDCFYSLIDYIDSIKGVHELFCDDNGYPVDSSVFKGYRFLGFINEGNNCYQNCVIQV